MAFGAGMDKLFQPSSIAVVGASERPDAIGSVVVANLLKWGFRGSIYPINPRYAEVHGLRCYPSLKSLGAAPDAVFLAVPAPTASAMLAEAGELGIPAAFINGTGFLDAGEAGLRLQETLLDAARSRGIALCGPNNMGLVNIVDRIPLWTSPDLPMAGPGPVAVISQSGAIAISLTYDAGHFAYSYIVTTGNEAVCTVSDYLAYIVEDDRVGVVQLFLETIRDTDLFLRAAARARERGIAILAVKVGRSRLGQAATAGHTGAVAGEDSVYDAFFRRAGVTRLDSLDQMIEATKLALRDPQPKSPGAVTILTLSGGEAALAADLAGKAGLALANLGSDTQDKLEAILGSASARRNPIDAWGKGWSASVFAAVLDAVADDPAVAELVCIVNPAMPESHDERVFVEMAEVCGGAQRAKRKPLMLASMVGGAGYNAALAKALAAHRIPYLIGLDTSLAALAAMRRRSQVSAQNRPVSVQSCDARRTALPRLDASLNEPALFHRLTEIGLPFAETVAVHSRLAAELAAARLGFPVVLKGTAADVPHKSELGLVRLRLRSTAAVGEAFDAVAPRLAHSSTSPTATVAVQRMLPRGIELLVSVRNDPAFGVVVVVGLGGVHVELLSDTATRLGPVDGDEAREMLSALRGHALLRGFRGDGPYDMDAAARFIAKLSDYCAASRGCIAGIEVNPLVVLSEGQGAIGADLVLQWADTAARR